MYLFFHHRFVYHRKKLCVKFYKTFRFPVVDTFSGFLRSDDTLFKEALRVNIMQISL